MRKLIVNISFQISIAIMAVRIERVLVYVCLIKYEHWFMEENNMRKFILSIVVCLAVLLGCLTVPVRAAGVAKVNGVEYATVQEAVNAAKNGDTVTLLQDSNTTAPITIDKSIIIEGNNCEIYYFGEYAALVIAYSDGSKRNVTLKNMRIVAKLSDRGISYEDGGTLTLDNVIVRGFESDVPHYALYLTLDSSKAFININNCDLTGNYGINVWGQDMTININDTKIYSADYSDAEDYAAIVLNRGDVYSAEETVINVTKSKIIAKDEDGIPSVAILNGTLSAEVNLDEQTEVVGTIKEIVAFVEDGPKLFLFYKLQEAIDYGIANNQPVEVVRSMTLDYATNINGEIEINGNGLSLYSQTYYTIIIDTVAEVCIRDFKISCIGGTIVGIYIINETAALRLDEVNISIPDGTAVNITPLAEAAKAYINCCNLSGIIALSVCGGKAYAEVHDSTLIGINNIPYNPGNECGTITIVANDVTVEVFGGSITAISHEGNSDQNIVLVQSAAFADPQVYLKSELIIEGKARILGLLFDSQCLLEVRKEYKRQLNNEGFATTPPDEDDMIAVDYTKEVFDVTYVADENVVTVIKVQDGENVMDVPAVPEKKGYVGEWSHDGRNISADTTITAVYTRAPFKIIDSRIAQLVIFALLGSLAIAAAVIYRKKRK